MKKIMTAWQLFEDCPQNWPQDCPHKLPHNCPKNYSQNCPKIDPEAEI